MKFYKVTLTTKDNVILDEKEFDLLINSPQQLVAIKKKDGSIKVIINKAHIVVADLDHTTPDNNLLLDGPEKPIQTDKIKALKELAYKKFGRYGQAKT